MVRALLPEAVPATDGGGHVAAQIVTQVVPPFQAQARRETTGDRAMKTANEWAETVKNKSCAGYPKWTVPLIEQVQADAREGPLAVLRKAVASCPVCAGSGFGALGQNGYHAPCPVGWCQRARALLAEPGPAGGDLLG